MGSYRGNTFNGNTRTTSHNSLTYSNYSMNHSSVSPRLKTPVSRKDSGESTSFYNNNNNHNNITNNFQQQAIINHFQNQKRKEIQNYMRSPTREDRERTSIRSGGASSRNSGTIYTQDSKFPSFHNIKSIAEKHINIVKPTASYRDSGHNSQFASPYSGHNYRIHNSNVSQLHLFEM